MPERPVPLFAHPAHPSTALRSIHVDIERTGTGLNLVYDVRGRLDEIRIPSGETGIRRDELWRHTCFELFMRDGTPSGYVEFNFSPGGDWAAYSFNGYRSGARDVAIAPPRINSSGSESQLIVTVSLNDLPPKFASRPLQLGPTVIIETKDGARSFWALDHLSEAPDFHRSETFTLSLE